MREAAKLLALPFCADRYRVILRGLFPSWQEKVEEVGGTQAVGSAAVTIVGAIGEIATLVLEGGAEKEAVRDWAESALKQDGGEWRQWLLAWSEKGKTRWRFSWLRLSADGELLWTTLPAGEGLEWTHWFFRRGGLTDGELVARTFDLRRWRTYWRGRLTVEQAMATISGLAPGWPVTHEEAGGMEEWIALDPSVPALLLERRKAQEGPEESEGSQGRRRSGIFYTPPALAAELCQRAVLSFLAGQVGEDESVVQAWLEQGEGAGPKAAELEAALVKMTILDMATGAGGLLLEMARQMVDLRERLARVRGQRFDSVARMTLRREVAERNLAGIDIDPEALGVARWRMQLFAGVCGDFLCADFLKPTSLKGRRYDLVIGNPPWGVDPDTRRRKALRRRYPVLPALAPDRSLAFTCRALELVGPRGGLAVLMPSAWLSTLSAEAFRRTLLALEVRELALYGDGVFPGAVVESLLMVLRAEPPRCEARRCRVRYLSQGGVALSQRVDPALWLRDPEAKMRLDLLPGDADLLERLRRRYPAFGELAVIRWGIKPYQVGRGSPAQTARIVRERPFHATEPQGSEWKPLVVGGDVDRYRVAFSGKSYLRYGPWLMYPSDESLLRGPKLLLRQTSDRIRCAYDDTGLYAQNSLFLIHSATVPLFYLLALLNSRFLGDLYRKLNPEQRRVFAEIKPSIIRELPIARGSEEEERQIAELAQEVSRRKGEGAEALEAEIDRRVKQLYL